MNDSATEETIVLNAEQIQKRVREIGRQLSDDYRGRTIHLVCVLEGAFVFMADLVRAIDGAVKCYFVRSDFREISQASNTTTEIFFSPEPDVRDVDVVLVRELLQTGVTSEFLMRNLLGRGASSVKLAVLLDRQSARRVSVQPDYFGFLIDEPFVFGYGMGDPQMRRNLPYIAAERKAGAGSAT